MESSYRNQSFSPETIFKMNTSLSQSNTVQTPEYCVLPIEHSHSSSPIYHMLSNNNTGQYSLLPRDQEESILSALAKNHILQEDNEIGTGPNQNGTKALVLHKSASGDGRLKTAEQQLLDPYIDAVKVKSRINNKRGPRVKALASPTNQQQHHHHLPSSSHHHNTKTIQVKGVVKLGGAKYDEYDDSSDDESDGDEEDRNNKGGKIYVEKVVGHYIGGGGGGEGNYDKGYHHRHGNKHNYGKGGAKRHRKGKPRKGYGQGGRGKLKKYHHYNQKGNKHAGHYQKGQPKKVTYAYVIQPVIKPVAVEENHYKGGGQGGGYNKHQYGNKYHGGYHGGHYHGGGGGGGTYGKSYGKENYGGKGGGHSYPGHHGKQLVKVDMMDKGKLSIAGLLGYTLLCVNYLLVLQQPTYNKYSGGYSKYSPHVGGSGEMVAIKSGGPIILASCGELPQTKALVKLPSNSIKTKLDGFALEAAGSSPAAATSPPAYHYTLKPPASAGSDNSLSPVQSYVHRLVIPAANNDNDEPIQVVRGPPRRLRLPASSQFDDNGGSTGRRLILSTGSRALGGGGGARARLEISLGDGPQVVRTQNNLADMRRRSVGIRMRVARRNHFNGALQRVRIQEDEGRDWVLMAGRGVTRDDQVITMIQADQPRAVASQSNTNNTTATTTTSNTNGSMVASVFGSQNNNQILDLPDYALSGDSIELTCNHRMPTSRLYSVKWFKDSMEFYRFIPANGARAKSSLFLPDVRLDLSRSNSETLYLRNVTHRTSGLYRCEAVSEGPNFETLTGEKRMQVYTLPQSGPQISILEQAEPPAVTSPGPLSPLLQTMLPIFTQHEPFSLSWPNLAPQQQPMQPLPVLDGPLVRCSSSRASPSAQLKFFINNRPVELSRTMKNSTLSYSDGMEANVASFRIALRDFRLDELAQMRGSQRTSGLDKGVASVKLDSKQTKLDLEKANLTTPIHTTTATTTTTPKPTMSSDKGKQQQDYANADVQFDDHNLPVKFEEFKAALEAKRLMGENEIDKETGRLHKKQNPTDQRQDKHRGNRMRLEMPYDGENEAEEEARAVFSSLAPVQPPLPVGADKANSSDRKSTMLKTKNTIAVVQPAANYVHSSVENGGESDQKISRTARAAKRYRDTKPEAPTLEIGLVGANSMGGPLNEMPNVPMASNTNRIQATSKEQRVRRQTGTTGDETEQVYSNYIRIKCTSLMPAVGYEMTSELNVPLTLLVPASQLSDAVTRQQPSQSGSLQQTNSNNRSQDDTLRRRQQQADDALLGAGRAIRNGGSLQAPRAVLIDRVAQGSAPPAKSTTLPAPGNFNGGSRPPQASNSTANGTALAAPKSTGSLRRGGAAAPQTSSSARDRALEQRSKYLEEMSKRSKSASNGCPSYLVSLRSLMVGGSYSRRPNHHGTYGAQDISLISLLNALVSYQITVTILTATWLATRQLVNIKDIHLRE